MDRIIFRDLPEIDGIELRVQNWHRLMMDERSQLRRDIDDVSLRLFGITPAETAWAPSNEGAPVNLEVETAWQKHFEFLSEEFDEEDAFWDAAGLDLTDGHGNYLECLAVFGRQLVCAIKAIHPAASLKFRTDLPRTQAQIEAEAEAWGKALTRGR